VFELLQRGEIDEAFWDVEQGVFLDTIGVLKTTISGNREIRGSDAIKRLFANSYCVFCAIAG
jgi:hypothetical protein